MAEAAIGVGTFLLNRHPVGQDNVMMILQLVVSPGMNVATPD